MHRAIHYSIAKRLAFLVAIITLESTFLEADEAINLHLRGLQSARMSQRVSAARGLSELGPAASEAVPALLEALKCERIEDGLCESTTRKQKFTKKQQKNVDLEM